MEVHAHSHTARKKWTLHNWNTEIPTFAAWCDYAKFSGIAKKPWSLALFIL